MLHLALAAALAITGLLGQTPRTAGPGSPSLLISAADLAASLKDPALVILHIGEPEAFEEAHVPGARFLRYGDFAVAGSEKRGSELPSVAEVQRVFEAVGVSNGSRVVLYGSSPVVAARAFFTLDVMGHRRVALLDGGLRAWRAEGRPIETGAAKAAA